MKKNKSPQWSAEVKNDLIKNDFEALLIIASNNIDINRREYKQVRPGEHLTSNRYQWRTSKRNSPRLTQVDRECRAYCKQANQAIDGKYYNVDKIKKRKVKRFVNESLSELLEMYLQVGKKEFRTITKLKKAIRKQWLMVYQDENTKEYFLVENFPKSEKENK